MKLRRHLLSPDFGEPEGLLVETNAFFQIKDIEIVVRKRNFIA